MKEELSDLHPSSSTIDFIERMYAAIAGMSATTPRESVQYEALPTVEHRLHARARADLPVPIADDVPKNFYGATTQEQLAEIERTVCLNAALREADYPTIAPGEVSLDALSRLHKRIYGDVYPSAGEFRSTQSIREVKFADDRGKPEAIIPSLTKAFSQWSPPRNQAEAIERGSEILLAIHATRPFHVGNTQVARMFTNRAIEPAGVQIAWSRLTLKEYGNLVSDKQRVMTMLGRGMESFEPGLQLREGYALGL